MNRLSEIEIKNKIQNSLNNLAKGDLFENSINLFEALGYSTGRQQKSDMSTSEGFIEKYLTNKEQNEIEKFKERSFLKDWKRVELLFQLTDFEMQGKESLFKSEKVEDTIMNSYLFFVIELSKRKYTRTTLATITRQINKLFLMPVMILFKYNDYLTLSIINRRLNKKDSSKDVLERITLIKDININNPHRAHIEILFDLNLNQIKSKNTVANFVELHNAWKKILDTKELNKKFYKEIANWYYWAVENVVFPDDIEKDAEKRNAINLIRLLTRIIFIWFIKEKGLIPEKLFNKEEIEKILNYKDKNQGIYYKAILQNLFFATLNQEMANREFRKDGSNGMKPDYGVTNIYRYKKYFKLSETDILNLFKEIPFLNGGLFECLDRFKSKDDNFETLENNIVRVDGFSDRDDNKLKIPDFLFWEKEKNIDLNNTFDTRGKNYKVRGLINILNNYKFTIEENTPIEEEIALDPELLGKVFENLLAAFNPETQTSARKSTGSYYTPREIVNYMVNESLKTSLSNLVAKKMENITEKDIKTKLDVIFEYTEKEYQFNGKEVNAMVEAISEIKILDPACGSGAFPMGVLHKLVFILNKLDPENKIWRKIQKERVLKDIENAYDIEDQNEREEQLRDIDETFEFNTSDYGRKLYLIENSIFGVDIQPIAVQISKLRFFISLIVDQKIDINKENYGIRPLPNLETKFVAANTLIGIEKPEQTLFAVDKNIKKLEDELKEIRHKIFRIKTTKTKRKYQDKDREIRKKIAKMLVEDKGFDNESAKQLAAWDPYDQNSSSPFFDMEWMFGITNGFDVVIANPPYIDSEGMVNMGQRDLREAIVRTYKMTKGNWDIYIAFFELGFKTMNKNGVLTFITPDKWLSKPFGDELRKSTLNNIFTILKAGRAVFESSNVDSIISFFSKRCHPLLKILDFKDDKVVFKREVNKSLLKSPFAFDYLFSDHLELLLNVDSIPDILSDISVCENACATSDAYKLKSLIQDSLEGFNQSNQLRIINTGTICKYSPRWGSHEMTYLKDRYLCPVVDRNEFVSLFNNAYARKSVLSKIIIKGLNLLDACLDADGNIIPGKSTLIIASDNIQELKFLLSILNSKFAFFYIKERYPASSYNQGTTFTKGMINKLPLPQIAINDQKPFVNLVDKILDIAKTENYFQNPVKQAKVKEYEHQIDQLVYELYGLTEEEIKIVEGGK